MHYVAQIRQHLLATKAITDLVMGDGVYVDFPAQTAPEPYAIIYTLNTDVTPVVSSVKCGAASASLKLIAVGKSRAQSSDVYRAVRAALQGFTSLATETEHVINGVDEASGEAWDVVNPVDGSDQRLFLTESTFTVDYTF